MKHPFDETRYNDILNAIFHRFPSVQTASFKDAYKPGLEGMQNFDAQLGHPHQSFKTLHIAGTNGKGSVSTMLAAALMANGYKVGLYTSPHLIDFRERMRIDGEMIPKEYVYDFFMDWQERFDELDLSFFEITTGMAFRWFADEKVDIAVIETGLGGRLDSTNIITPELSIITSIGLDHCSMLGNTLAAIAGEKAGILKPGVPAVIGEVCEETRPVFIRKASETGSTLYFAPELTPLFWDRHSSMLDTDLHGEYQAINLRTVLTALEVLAGKGLAIYRPQELSGQQAEVRTLSGIRQAADLMHFHGRWEFVCTNPYVLCDIGHNAHALRHNFSQLKRMMASGRFSSLTLVFGIMADKDLDAVLPLMPTKANYIFTQAQTSRALDSKTLKERFLAAHPEIGETTGQAGRIFDMPTVGDAVRNAMEYAAEESRHPVEDPVWGIRKPLIYIGGSNFIVSEAFPMFQK